MLSFEGVVEFEDQNFGIACLHVWDYAGSRRMRERRLRRKIGGPRSGDDNSPGSLGFEEAIDLKADRWLYFWNMRFEGFRAIGTQIEYNPPKGEILWKRLQRMLGIRGKWHLLF